jgi:flavin-dependent dehydrogenase
VSGTRADVAVIGGGPAGVAAAIALVRGGARVVVAHDAAGRAGSAGETVPPAARPLLRDLDLWSSVASGAHRPVYANESAWGSDSVARTDFTCDPNGHGWHVDRPLLDGAWREVARRAGACVMHGARVAGIARVRDEWHLDFRVQESTCDVRSRWVIDCTGRTGVMATHFGVGRSHDDRLVAAVATLARCGDPRGDDRDGVTFVESTPDGWWFTAAAPAGRRVLVYFTDFSEPSARAAASGARFTALWGATPHLRERVRPDLWRIASGPRLRPAGSTRLGRPGGDGWLAAGDALMAFDPISSQGVMTAVYTGYRAAEAVLGSAGGRGDVEARYAEMAGELYDAYLDASHRCYSSEQRWASHRFWRVRHDRRRAPTRRFVAR